MLREIIEALLEKYDPRFGQVSVEKGYVNPEQLKQAILEQIDDELANKPHRLIGRIMLDNGWMTAEQIVEVLDELLKRKIGEN